MGQELQKILIITKIKNEIFSIQNQSGFPVQNQLKTKKKKRSSLKFSPVFGPKLGAGQKQRSSHTVCVLKPSAQLTKEGPMPQFCILLYAKCTILATQRGHGLIPPLKYGLGCQCFLVSVGVYLTDIYFDIVWGYHPGAYLGGAIGPWPPFGSPESYDCIE